MVTCFIGPSAQLFVAQLFVAHLFVRVLRALASGMLSSTQPGQGSGAPWVRAVQCRLRSALRARWPRSKPSSKSCFSVTGSRGPVPQKSIFFRPTRPAGSHTALGGPKSPRAVAGIRHGAPRGSNNRSIRPTARAGARPQGRRSLRLRSTSCGGRRGNWGRRWKSRPSGGTDGNRTRNFWRDRPVL